MDSQGAVKFRLEGLLSLWVRGGRGSSDGWRACGRSLRWASVCPHACLSVALKEAGAGLAAAWAEQILRGTQLSSGYRLTASLPTHLDSRRGASGQALPGEKIVEISFSRQSNQPSGGCSGNGLAGRQPLEGRGELRLGVSWAMIHLRSLHLRLYGGGGGVAKLRRHPALGWPLAGEPGCRLWP